MISRDKCFEALDELTNLSSEEKLGFRKMCTDGLSIGKLFEGEIPKIGTCSIEDAKRYISEESIQMQNHLNVDDYNMYTISVPEHVKNEDTAEPEHHGLPKGYAGVPGQVKFFVEWLEGHHPSLGCMFGSPDEVPSEELYDEFDIAKLEARRYRKPVNAPMAFVPRGY